MPAIGQPIQGYYYDQTTDTLRPMGALGVGPGMEVCFIADASLNVTLTSLAAAVDWLAASVRHVTKVDLDGMTQCRFVVRRMATASTNGTLRLVYSLVDPGSTYVAGNWTTLASVSLSTGTNITLDSLWATLPAGAKVANVYLAVTQGNGDGTQSPVIGSVRAYFK